jgi:hypothetical protein
MEFEYTFDTIKSKYHLSITFHKMTYFTILEKDLHLSSYFQIKDIPKILRNEIIHQNVCTNFGLLMIDENTLQLEIELLILVERSRKRISEIHFLKLTNGVKNKSQTYLEYSQKELVNIKEETVKCNQEQNRLHSDLINLLDRTNKFNNSCDELLLRILSQKINKK